MHIGHASTEFLNVKFFAGTDLSCLIIAQKMYESEQTNFAIKENKTVNSLL